jgi:4-hydroxyphenylacetate 3-monooxygenase
MAIRTGKQYLDDLRDGREVWLEGERVEDVPTHPKLRRMAHTLAGLYDLQHDPALGRQMTFTSPASGEPVALSYMVPYSHEDLYRRRRAFEIVVDACHGMLGRTPDVVNLQVTGVRQMAAEFGAKEPWLGENLIAYHEYIREHDLCLTHAFGHPQVNRGAPLTEQPDTYVALGIVETHGDGIVVRGAKSLATLAPFANELYCPPWIPARPEEAMYCLGFAIPVATSGLKFICRESYDRGLPLYDRPLSGQYDELDAYVIFDNVLIPWSRVFSYNDVEVHNKLVGSVVHEAQQRQNRQQVLVRQIGKLEFALGVARELTEAIGIGGFAHVQEKVAEIIDTLETTRAFLRAAEADAGPWHGDGIWLAAEPCTASRNAWPDAWARVAAILQQLAAGGLMLTPTQADMEGPARPLIDKYFQGANVDAYHRVRLFRVVWDLIGTPFGARSTLYERYFSGDVVRHRQNRYRSYDYTRATKSYRDFMDELPHS